MKWTQEKYYTIELEICNVIHMVEFKRKTTFVEDFNYGADADGHRGSYVLLTDEDYADEIYINSIPLEKFNEFSRKEIEKEINNWLELNEVEPEKENYQGEK